MLNARNVFVVGLTIIFIISPAAMPQTNSKTSPPVEQHIRTIIEQLPPDSPLRDDLLHGSRGDGIDRPWMHEMREQDVKRAVVMIKIGYRRNGRPQKMSIYSIEYFGEYGDGGRILDGQRLNSIRATSLEKMLGDLALQIAAKGGWVDVPHPRPHPFVGGTRLEFFDDPWLPIPSPPLYCAGNSCLVDTR